jgi:hypothetical protein
MYSFLSSPPFIFLSKCMHLVHYLTLLLNVPILCFEWCNFVHDLPTICTMHHLMLFCIIMFYVAMHISVRIYCTLI